MNFKKYYINGNVTFKIEFRFSRDWNNFMLWLTRKTTFDPEYNIVYYKYMGDTIMEKIESWYEKPKFWFFTGKKGVQHTRSTFVKGNSKKEIRVKHFTELYK